MEWSWKLDYDGLGMLYWNVHENKCLGIVFVMDNDCYVDMVCNGSLNGSKDDDVETQRIHPFEDIFESSITDEELKATCMVCLAQFHLSSSARSVNGWTFPFLTLLSISLLRSYH